MRAETRGATRRAVRGGANRASRDARGDEASGERGRIIVGLTILLLLSTAMVASAEQWGAIVPGESTMESVRAQYGAPSRNTTQKTDKYDTMQWVYEGPRAPFGVKQLTIDFGLLQSGQFRPNLVRSFVLEPNPGGYDRTTVLNGWGSPHGVGREGESEFFFYKEGLLVYFTKDGQGVVSMVFTPPQLPPTDGGARKP